MRASRWLWLAAAAVLLAAGCGKKPWRGNSTALHRAAEYGRLAEVQRLIAHGANVNARDDKGRTPLHLVAKKGYDGVAEVLVRCGAEVDAQDNAGRTPALLATQANQRTLVQYLVGEGAAVNLSLAVYLGDAAKVKSFIDAGADVNAKDGNTWTPLQYAVSRGYLEVARLLIAAGADVNVKGPDRSFPQESDGGTVLHSAVQADRIELVELLMDSGADPEVRDKYGRTPLEWAVVHGRLAMVKLLLAKGANPNSRGEENYFCSGTPLGLAIEKGYVDVAEALLAGGADANAKEDSGWTPLHVAVTGCYEPAVEAAVPMKPPELDDEQAYRDQYHAMSEKAYAALVTRMLHVLIDHGADVKAKDEEGVTPLHCAAHNWLREAVELLIAQGADVNARIVPDPHPDYIAWERDLGYRLRPGATPLHEAVLGEDPCVVQTLLTHGAQVGAADEAGATALHYATAMGNTGAVRLLIAQGADVNARDATGATPLADALLRGHVKVARVLIAAGAEKVDVKKDSATNHTRGIYIRVERPLLHWALGGYLPPVRAEGGVADANEHDLRRGWTELLLANGADPNERDDKGNTPLHDVILTGNGDLARLFIAHGTDVNARNQGNITALHYAANEGRADLVSLLLAHGAEVNARDNDGDTPLHNAARRGHQQVVEALLAAGADGRIRNSRGRTPLDEAARRGHQEIVQLLAAKAKGAPAAVEGGETTKQ